MMRAVWSLSAVLALAAAPAGAQDAGAFLQAAAKAIGADTLKCVSYTGANGYVGIVGQAHDIKNDWPRVELASISRTINFDAKTMVEERVIRQGNYPRIGGGGIPIQGEQRQQNFASGRFAWTVQNGNAVAQPDQADIRQLDILM